MDVHLPDEHMPGTFVDKSVLFFSRGKGRGHAIPDAAIAEEILKLDPGVDVTFVSYSLGASTLRQLGWKTIDLELPEDVSPWEIVVRAMHVLRRQRPLLVISHEEFSAIPVSMGFGVPAVFLTDWFLSEESLQMQCLKYATEVIFLDEPGYFDEPSYLRGRIYYAGFVFRRLDLGEDDKAGVRLRFGVPYDSTVITVVPGGAGMHTEARSPLFDLVFGAFEALDVKERRLLWIVGDPDYALLVRKVEGLDGISIFKPQLEFSPILVASDLIITKGNRTPLLECEVMGIPSISISSGLNAVDDYRIGRISSNTALRLRGLNCKSLRDHMLKSLESAGEVRWKRRKDYDQGRILAAQRLCCHVQSAACGASLAISSKRTAS
jgi:hypothetical protein